MDSRNLSKEPLEPDLIVQGEKVVFMSDAEQKRRVVAGWAEVCLYLARVARGGF